MKKQRSLLLFLLSVCLLLGLSACWEKEEVRSGGVVYVPDSVAFTSPLDETESACVSGDTVYLSGTVYSEDISTEQNFSLVRVPLEGGKAEPLPAFHPAQLEGEHESTGGYLRPGKDGTIWLTEEVYCTGLGRTLVLRQLDGEGNELFFFDGSALRKDLGAEQLHDLWTDGAGTFFVNTGDRVALLDESGVVQATLEGTFLAWNRFVTLGDGRTAILDTTQSVEGYTSRLRVIDSKAGDWAEGEFPVISGASCFQRGEGDVLFYYTSGDALYAWRQGAEEAERIMSWMDAGMNANGLRSFSFLEDGRLAAVVLDRGFRSKPEISVLTATDAASLPERTVLTLAVAGLSSELRTQVAAFNRSSPSCFIQVIDYLPDWTFSTTLDEVEQARLRLVTDLAAGNTPDMVEAAMFIPVRRMEAQGLLEDLWPYIESDPELGRDALMTRPLEAVEYNGGLYRVAPSFGFDTIIGPRSVVGDRLTWAYEDCWEALNTVPDGTAVAGFGSKASVLRDMIEYSADSFIDWENGVCRFEGEEFHALLEFCNRFPAEADPDYIPDIAIYTGEQILQTGVVPSPDWFQYNKGLIGSDVSCVGFPNEAGAAGTRFRLLGTSLAITAASEHKEEAWSFLRQSLLPKLSAEKKLQAGERIENFPINRADFEITMTRAMTPLMATQNGELMEIHRYSTGFDFFDLHATVFIDTLTQEEHDQIMELYDTAEGTRDYDVNLLNIVIEQAGPYFAGDKSLDDTVAAIQSRVGLYLAELQ